MENPEIKCPVCGSIKNRSFRPRSSDGSWRMYACKGCLTHFQFPNLQKASLYDESYFTGAGSDRLVDYSYIDRFDEEIIKDRVKKLVGICRSSSKVFQPLNILDIGPGNGSFCIVAQNFGKVCAMDIATVNEKIMRENGYRDNFMVNDLEKTSQDRLSNFKNYFDIIHISEVVEHLSFPEIFFENVAYLAKENGVLFIQTGRSDSFISMICRGRWSYYRTVHSIIYSKKSIMSLLVKSGFEVLSVKRDFESFGEVSKLITFNLKGNPKRCVTHLLTYVLGRCIPRFGRMQLLARKTRV